MGEAFFRKGKHCRCMFILLLVPVLIFSTPEEVDKSELPVYRVVIDPGHGGISITDKQKHGDRYDKISGEYKSYYAEGAKRKNINEHLIVYSIAEKTVSLLKHCSTEGDFEKFRKILNKYTNEKVKRVYIETHLSRGPSVSKKKAGKMKDPNAEFRLYDYPGENGEINPGRISKINSFNPHIVVCLHLAASAPPDYLGMNPILAPPYKVLQTGLLNLQKGGSRSINDCGILESWFRDSVKISPQLAYYKDVVNYFTGFDLNRDYTVNQEKFNGYKYNMTNWDYADEPGWNETAKLHKAGTRYSNNIKTFKEEGAYWEREKSVHEQFRRGENFENFGGDNSLSSYEIIRYILLSLDKKGISRKDKIPGKAFISTWSIPLMVNAVCAYIELGYLNRPWDKEVLLRRHDEIAEGVAVGIYSLFAGIEKIEGKFKYNPSGQSIDFEKYRVSPEKTYFDLAVDKK